MLKDNGDDNHNFHLQRDGLHSDCESYDNVVHNPLNLKASPPKISYCQWKTCETKEKNYMIYRFGKVRETNKPHGKIVEIAM